MDITCYKQVLYIGISYTAMETFTSDISGKEFPLAEKTPGKIIRPALLAFIQKEHPGFTGENYISYSEVNHYHEKYISQFLLKQAGELSDLESAVIDSITENKTVSSYDNDSPGTLTLGQKIADNIATFGGSWTFIISFGIFLLLWITLNSVWILHTEFDPFPFILLNLILSCIAALQAPVIMMSQNRQEEKDRERAKKDYMTNLKSELEIRLLHEKIDHLILHQQQELFEIQKKQSDMLTRIMEQLDAKK